MIETDHGFVVEAPIGAVWDYARDIGNWASSMPGYESFEEVDEVHSNWVLKVALGALTKRVPLKVTIIERREPEHISFELRGRSDPVEGRGTFTAEAQGPRQTSVEVTLAIWGSGQMAAPMEAMSRPVVPALTRGVSESFKKAVEQTGVAACDALPVQATPRPAIAEARVGDPRGRRQRWSRWRARLLGWTRRAHRTNRGSS
jgi:carbon monoxide dehydrogenase subunit G